jgi:F0F1-type ATP synthase delta subunit
VRTAYELDDSQKNELSRKLSEAFNSEVFLEQDLDPELLAGLEIQVDDYLMNYSIRDELEDLYGRFRRN